MGIEDLSDLEIFYGISNLIFVIITIIIGIKILLNYFSLKRKEFITVGLTLIFLVSGYWSVTINFVLIVFFNSLLPTPISIFIENAFIPIGLICWIYSFGELVYPNLKKKLMLITLIICIPYEIFLIVFSIVNPAVIAIQVSTFYTQRGLISMAFNLFVIVFVVITVILFAKKSLESDKRVVRLKGKFLLIGALLVSIGTLIDTAVPMNILSLAFIRIIFIVGSVLYYFGFFFPEKSNNKDKKEKKN